MAAVAAVAMRDAKPSFVAPDQTERSRALDPSRSFLVQAPAGSGKTQLLTQRFLRLLGEAERPEEIVAITFTNAAAAEMRHRILAELEKAEAGIAVDDTAVPGLRGETWGTQSSEDPESLGALARRALERSKRLGWQILDQPNQLRITTIDAFCHGLAAQSPLSWGLLTGLGGRLEVAKNADELYRLAARRTLQQLESADTPARRSIERLLLWRDNNWRDVEKLIVDMLRARNRWYQGFVFARDVDWELIRKRLEAPFCRGARGRLERVMRLLDGLPGVRERAHELARFACGNGGKYTRTGLAELAEFPAAQILEAGIEEAAILADAVDAHFELAQFLMTEGRWRKEGGLNVHRGFPATDEGRAAKRRFGELVEELRKVEELESALAAFLKPMPTRYSDEEWELVRDCFAVLRGAALQLQVVFAETGSVDFTQVAQLALNILAPENGIPSDFAMEQAGGIRHLLIDEFQDTSRNQHQMLSQLIGAWPERDGRSCFCVGDPMQSIYGFRDAEVELFERVKSHGLETPSDPDSGPLQFDFVALRANFRTVPSLVNDLNGIFEAVFADAARESEDSILVRFTAAEAARSSESSATTELHLVFTRSGRPAEPQANPADEPGDPAATREQQLEAMVTLIRAKIEGMELVRRDAALHSEKKARYRIAVLGRKRGALLPVADALRKAGIRFRSIDLVKLDERPEVLDALSLARAMVNPMDRSAWLGVLRAPWCGLSLAELHLLTSADEDEVIAAPVPKLLEERLPALYASGLLNQRAYEAAARVGRVLRTAATLRADAAGFALGTWLESVWKALGGEDTVDAEQRENLKRLWTCLDGLKEGELDLTGPGLAEALTDLFALPDPEASSDFGVQLMTIHKSKGLEFEVVIVPDLEARETSGDSPLMSWLERGLEDSDEGDGATEFLIAPIQTKGADRSATRMWVDEVKKEREKQELRRVLYVAATRAREELHLFARPRFREKLAKDGSLERTLSGPTGLLATAWPAFKETIEERFEDWLEDLADRVAPGAEDYVVSDLAAQGSPENVRENLVQMPTPVQPTIVRRLPADYVAPPFSHSGLQTIGLPQNRSTENVAVGEGGNDEARALFERTEGAMRSRLLGTAVHGLMEELSRLRRRMDAEAAALALPDSLPRIIADLRGHGLAARAAEKLGAEALAVAKETLLDPAGGWIVTAHRHAESEVGWTGLISGGIWNIRPDRVFFAPPFDDPEGEARWWIIDYKTSYANEGERSALIGDAAQAFLKEHRERHAGQLAAYAQVLRGLKGGPANGLADAIRVNAGIYYPRLRLFDFWEA